MAPFYPSRVFKKIPRQLLIELTNSCQLRCPVCPTHFAMKRKRGFMDFDLYKMIIDDLKDCGKKPDIAMIFAGEPLLHREIDKFVEYAALNGHATSISTNAVALSEDLSERLIKAGLACIHLCLDGFSKGSHEAYRMGSNFETVKKNIEDFILTKKALNSKNPFIIIQTLLTSFSEDEMDDIIDWAKRTGADAINLKTLSLGSYTTELMKAQFAYLLPAKKEFRRRMSNINKTLCSSPTRDAIIYWNGELGLCCVDFDNEIKLGNIKEMGFLKTLFSEGAIKKRKLGFQKKFDLCKKCSMNSADFLGKTINF